MVLSHSLPLISFTQNSPPSCVLRATFADFLPSSPPSSLSFSSIREAICCSICFFWLCVFLLPFCFRVKDTENLPLIFFTIISYFPLRSAMVTIVSLTTSVVHLVELMESIRIGFLGREILYCISPVK